jgi:hypothetical protein
MSRHHLLAILAGMLLLHAPPAAAVSGAGGIVMQFDTSVRTTGMGGAGTAVFWGDDPSGWANPALLGYHRGIRFSHLRSQLAPGLADDIFLYSDRLTLGYQGIGLSLGGQPFDALGGEYLDMGLQEGIDEQGNPVGTFQTYMNVRSVGMGASLATVWDRLLGLAGPGGRPLGQFADLALGLTFKDFEDFLAPDNLLQDNRGGRGEASTMDWGYLARLSLYDSVDQPGIWPALDRFLDPLSGGLRIAGARGRAVHNFDDEWIVHVDIDQGDPAPKAYRRAWSVHVASGLPAWLREPLQESDLGWLAGALTPLISWGQCWEDVTAGILWDSVLGQYVFAEDERDREERSGWELTIANVWSIRRGRVDYATGDVHGDTEGQGFGLRIGPLASFRYDEAKVPQAVGLPRVKRHGYTVQVDALALWAFLRGRSLNEVGR